MSAAPETTAATGKKSASASSQVEPPPWESPQWQEAVSQNPGLAPFFDNLESFVELPEGVEKLRGLTLGLAFQGKMPGADAVPFAEWDMTTVAEIADRVQPGAACGKQHVQDGGYVHLRTHNISTEGVLNFDLMVRVNPEKIDPKKAHLKKGNVIFNNTNSQELVGKTALVDHDYDYAFSNHLTLIQLKEEVKPAFLVGYFQYLLKTQFFFNLCNRWIGQAGINTKVLKEIQVPLPPLAEQRRIVSKVEGLMSLCDTFESHRRARECVRERASRSVLVRLTSAPREDAARSKTSGSETLPSAWQRLSDHFEILLDQPSTVPHLRQSILQLAVQGKLVPQDPSDETAEQLLKTIDARRAELVASKVIKKTELYPAIASNYEPYKLPCSWCWVRIGQIARLVEYGTSEKAKGGPSDVPVLRMGNIQEGEVVLDNLKYVHKSIEDLPNLYLQHNEILFNRTNSWELVGKTGVFKGPAAQYTFASYLIRVRTFADVDPDFVNLGMNAPYYRETQIIPTLTQQCGQANFNGTKMKNSLVPLAPEAEQKRIVSKVSVLLSQCDELSSRLRSRQSTTDALLTALIHQILEGTA